MYEDGGGHSASDAPGGVMYAPGKRPIVVLGLGNLLRRDEGLGIRAMERLRERYLLPGDVELVDGGTLGLDLLCYLEETERLLILDAALTGGPPGTLMRATGQEIPAFLGIRTSPHEVALADLLAVARLRGTEPRELAFLGMQPATIELGWDLTEPVARHLDDLADAAADVLRQWDRTITKRATWGRGACAAPFCSAGLEREEQPCMKQP